MNVTINIIFFLVSVCYVFRYVQFLRNQYSFQIYSQPWDVDNQCAIKS